MGGAAATSGGLAADGPEASASSKVAALQAELAAKQKEVEAKDQELAMLKDMVRARKSDARTRELKSEVHQRRRIRTDAPPGGMGAGIEISPSSVASGTPSRMKAANMMQQL